MLYGSGIERKHNGKQTQQSMNATECKRNATQMFLQRDANGVQHKQNGNFFMTTTVHYVCMYEYCLVVDMH